MKEPHTSTLPLPPANRNGGTGETGGASQFGEVAAQDTETTPTRLPAAAGLRRL